ncbi:unnamed protein product [Colias eurytheme]|nr:unnamed protein product [Colias eurytheme]
MCTRALAVYLIIINICVTGDFGPKNANNYGFYVVVWEHFDQCRGPKMVNVTNFVNTLLINEENHYIGRINMTFLEDARIDEMKIYVYTVKEGVKKLMWNYNIKKPCQHYVFAALLESHLGVKNCGAKKGVYFSDMDLTVLMAKYIGDQFFYGEYLFKVVILSKKGNIMCVYFDPKFKKKEKVKS